MRPLLVLNDIHIGVKRVAGTTPDSQIALRQCLAYQFSDFIDQYHGHDLLINGDLFDGFDIDSQDLLITYFVLVNWLVEGKGNLYLAAGNHDIGKRTDQVSSFALLARLLQDRFPNQVMVIDKGLTTIQPGVHVIPHCMNQDLFNLELKLALEAEPGYLFLHANVDNGFAENSDHSLNVDGEWLTKLSKIHTIVFGHEHQGRSMKYGKKAIYVLGNQWPSSISDCLAHGEAQKDGIKKALIIRDRLEPDEEGTEMAFVPTWTRKGSFIEMPWNNLQVVDEKFIRITGTATSAQASEMITTIAKYRNVSPAFVISNAVEVEGVEGLDEFSQATFENIKVFDVKAALLDMLDPEERKAVEELLKD